MKPRDSDLIRQVEDGLDNERRQPVKELGVPDYREDDEQESRKRDSGWEDLGDERRTPNSTAERPIT
jgi:hypothetical protein